MKKKILIGVGLISAAIAGYFIFDHMTYVTTDNAQVEAHSVLLAAKVTGYILKVNVTEGQKVKKGDLLAEIDDRDYQNTLRQISSELTSIEAREKDAQKNFRRLVELYRKGAVSQQQFDTSSTAFSEVKAKFDAVSAQVSQAQLNLENTKIKAPSDGFIAKKSIETGQFTSPGIPLIGFVEANERWVTANFKETEIEDIKIGNKVDISVDAVTKKDYKGIVESISSATGAMFALLPPDNATGNFTKVVQRVPVKIKFENIDESDSELLKAGLSASAKVHRH